MELLVPLLDPIPPIAPAATRSVSAVPTSAEGGSPEADDDEDHEDREQDPEQPEPPAERTIHVWTAVAPGVRVDRERVPTGSSLSRRLGQSGRHTGVVD